MVVEMHGRQGRQHAVCGIYGASFCFGKFGCSPCTMDKNLQMTHALLWVQAQSWSLTVKAVDFDTAHDVGERQGATFVVRDWVSSTNEC
jgi:hypothetical protein